MAEFQFFTVDRFGGNRAEHPRAYASTPLEKELNEPGSLTVTIPNSDPNIGNVQEHARELMVWRNWYTPWWQGKIERKTYDPLADAWDVEVVGLRQYFNDLHVGRANRVNWVRNGSFDEGSLAEWEAIGVTANVVTEWGFLPDQSTYQANLYQAGAGEDTFIRQRIDVPGGVYWTLSAWFHIRTDSEWVGPAFDNRGLFIERRHPDTNALEDVQFAQITDDTPRGVFQRLTCNMWSPPGRDSVFWVRLYATRCTNASPTPPRPPGSIIWDEVQLVAMESLSYPHQDVGGIVDGLVSHAQDPEFGRVYLGIDTPGAGTTGVYTDRYYQFADHPNIGDELKALSEAGICDIDVEIEWNNEAQKMDKHVRAYGPRQGSSDKPWSLELGAEHSVSELASIEMNGQETKTTVIVRGEGSGPDREEASASDTSETGGVVIEEIFDAPENTHKDLLHGMALYRVSRSKGVPRIPALTLSTFMTDKVELGDVFTVITGIDGPWAVVGNFRVTHISHDFDTDRLTVQVVEV